MSVVSEIEDLRRRFTSIRMAHDTSDKIDEIRKNGTELKGAYAFPSLLLKVSNNYCNSAKQDDDNGLFGLFSSSSELAVYDWKYMFSQAYK